MNAAKPVSTCACVAAALLLAAGTAEAQGLPAMLSELESQVGQLEGTVDQLEGQMGQLQGRITELERAHEPISIAVNCGAGETVSDALLEAQHTTGHVTISIEGICNENVNIYRDDVWLRGQGEGAGIEADSGALLQMWAVKRVWLENLTLLGGDTGLSAEMGASFEGSGLLIKDSRFAGVWVSQAASGLLSGSTVENASQGIKATQNGSVILRDCLIDSSMWSGVEADFGGQVQLADGSEVQDSGSSGVSVVAGGSVELQDSVIERSGDVGLHLNLGGSAMVIGSESAIRDNGQRGIWVNGGEVWITGGATIRDNGQEGVVATGGRVHIQQATVEHNTLSGVTLEAGSSLFFQDGVAQDNGQSGISVADASVVMFGGQSGLLNNGQYGVQCAGHPAVPQLTGNWAGTTAAGNPSGDTNCPVSP